MHKGKYVFAQLLDFIDKDVFLRLANKYDGNRYVKLNSKAYAFEWALFRKKKGGTNMHTL